MTIKIRILWFSVLINTFALYTVTIRFARCTIQSINNSLCTFLYWVVDFYRVFVFLNQSFTDIRVVTVNIQTQSICAKLVCTLFYRLTERNRYVFWKYKLLRPKVYVNSMYDPYYSVFVINFGKSSPNIIYSVITFFFKEFSKGEIYIYI